MSFEDLKSKGSALANMAPASPVKVEPLPVDPVSDAIEAIQPTGIPAIAEKRRGRPAKSKGKPEASSEKVMFTMRLSQETYASLADISAAQTSAEKRLVSLQSVVQTAIEDHIRKQSRSR